LKALKQDAAREDSIIKVNVSKSPPSRLSPLKQAVTIKNKEISISKSDNISDDSSSSDEEKALLDYMKRRDDRKYFILLNNFFLLLFIHKFNFNLDTSLKVKQHLIII
jgi:hypothetical protein